MSGLAVNKANLFGYSIMAFPLAFAGIPLYIHAPDFYSAALGASLTSIGAILLILRILDALADPFIGYYSDKYSNKRNAILTLGIFLLATGFFGLFNPIEEYLMASFTINVFLATFGFSIISINLNTLGGIWSDNYNEKTKISAAREAFGLIGLIFAAALPAVLISKFGNNEGFQYFSWIMLLILSLSSFIFFTLWLNNFSEKKKPSNATTLNEIFVSLSKNKGFFLVYFVSALASSIPAVLIIFFVRDRLGLEEYLGLFLVTYFLSGALSMPLWQKISESSNKISAWKNAMILAVATFIWAFFLEEGNLYQFLIVCIASGFAFGAELALPPSILADKVSKNSATTEYSILTFLMKAGLAVSAGVAFPILESNGFNAGEENSSEALWILSLLYALIPCIIKIISIILLHLFLKTKGGKDEKNINNNGGLHVSN